MLAACNAGVMHQAPGVDCRAVTLGVVGAPPPAWWRHARIALVPADCGARLDGLIAWHGSSRAFVAYEGPKVFYSDEPLRHVLADKGLRDMLRRLRPGQFLHHAQKLCHARLPAITHYGVLSRCAGGETAPHVAAAVSNYGGRYWWRHGRGTWLRNRLITNGRVHLYGDRGTWARFRRWPWSRAGAPANYLGPLAGDWRDLSQAQALSAYRAVICLENTYAPHYFTEKFVNVARAGAIPIYHAHRTVRDGVLAGARWIDPADLGFRAEACLDAALSAERGVYRAANFAWLDTERVKASDGHRVWQQVVDAVLAQRSAV